MSLANCNKHLQAHGKPNPRTCQECQLGPCKYPDGFMKIEPTEAASVNPVSDPWSHVITSCSVKVMRSFDYCHFEVVLGGESESLSLKDVDDLRKHAARLADKAVEQYKKAKRAIALREAAQSRLQYGFLKAEIARIEAKVLTDLTPEEMATLKSYKDDQFRASRPYDYQDDWQDDDEE